MILSKVLSEHTNFINECLYLTDVPDEGYKLDILSVLRSIVFEKNYPLLEGNNPDSKFIASNNLSFLFTILQLALVDIGLLFTFTEMTGGSFSAMENPIIFLVSMNSVVILLLYFIVSRTNKKLTNKKAGYLYILKFPLCKSCKVDLVSNQESLYHKIENPGHELDNFEVRVKIVDTSKVLDIFRIYELIPLMSAPLFLSLLTRMYNSDVLALAIPLPYMLLIVIYLYRYLKRKYNGTVFRYLYIKHASGSQNSSQEFITMRLILIDRRYLKEDSLKLNDYPVVYNITKDLIFLIGDFESDFYGNIRVKPYRGLESGIYFL